MREITLAWKSSVDDNICDICKKADGKLNAIVSYAKNVY